MITGILFSPDLTRDIKYREQHLKYLHLQMYTTYSEWTENEWSEAKDAGTAFNPVKTMLRAMSYCTGSQ